MDPSELDDLLRGLEEAASADPGDRALASRIEELADRRAAEASLPAAVGGVRRDALVRWDRFSATFAGTALATGEPAMVRVLRPDAAREPVLRRHLLREGRALARVLPVEIDEDPPALRTRLAGDPLGPVRGDALAAALGSGIAAIARWEHAGLGLPPLVDGELRLDRGRATVACLTATGDGVRAAVAALAATLAAPDDEGVLAATARALVLAPTDTAGAADALRQALVEALTERRHALAARWRAGAHRLRRERLRGALARLSAAVPAPVGRGAVGVDLEGRITAVEADARSVAWGPEGAREVVWDGDGFRPPVARRLLRARAASPPNPTLDARIGGQPSAADALCRWVGAGLQLRTVRLLLDQDPG